MQQIRGPSVNFLIKTWKFAVFPEKINPQVNFSDEAVLVTGLAASQPHLNRLSHHQVFNVPNAVDLNPHHVANLQPRWRIHGHTDA